MIQVTFNDVTDDGLYFKQYGVMNDPGLDFTGDTYIVLFRYVKDERLFQTAVQFDFPGSTNFHSNAVESPQDMLSRLSDELGVRVQMCFISQQTWTSVKGRH